MPKGQRKYKGTQKVEIIERMRREQMSFHEASRSYEIPRRTLQDCVRRSAKSARSVELSSGSS